MPVKAFVFDCGGVLLRGGDLSAYAVWEERLGLAPGELAPRLWEGQAWSLAERGALTEDQFWHRVGRELGLKDEAEVADLRHDIEDTWSVNDAVLAIIDRVRERYPVHALSNATDGLEDALERRYGVADRFCRILNSARLGVSKPDPAIYEEMLRQLDLEPQEVVLIDDRAENIAAAAAMGIHVVWFIHAAELGRQLRVYLDRNDNGDHGDSGSDDD